jgi:phytoene synthase
VNAGSSWTLPDARRFCREITRRRARNFYYGLKLSPEPQRTSLYVAYAWMRHADDLADDAARPEIALAHLDAWKISTDAALAGAPPTDDPILVALADVAARYPLDAACFHGMLDGQRDDLVRREIKTFDELAAYCRKVASTVGLLCIRIWGCSDPRADRPAIDRGIAFQLTNVLRDIRQDFDAGRVYLPREDFVRSGLTPADLRAWRDAGACTPFLLDQIARAESFYQRSSGLEAYLPPACRPSLWVMTEIYRRLLARMRAAPASIVQARRVRLSSIEKGTLALRASWRAHAARSGAAAAAEHGAA